MARPKKPLKKFAGTKQALSKVETAPNLFIHEGTGIYYARSRRGGKDLIKCLETKNRREADAALQDWFKEIATPKGKAGSFRVLLDDFLTVRKLLANKTQENDKYVVKLFKEYYPGGVDIPASRVTTLSLIAWISAWAGTKEEPKIKAATYNRYRSTVKQVFQMAVDNGTYPENRNPYRANSIPKRATAEIIRLIPSEAEFQAIIAHVRGQKYNAERDKTGDFLEFMGRAGLGQAEVAQIKLRDVDFDKGDKGEIEIRRKKTGKTFSIPIYDWLRPVLDKAIERLKAKSPETRIFQIQDAKKALGAACEALNLPHFTQRNLRAMLIKRLWKSGVDVQVIAEWQGHTDNGKLIIATYTKAFSSEDKAYKRRELAKAAAYLPV